MILATLTCVPRISRGTVSWYAKPCGEIVAREHKNSLVLCKREEKFPDIRKKKVLRDVNLIKTRMTRDVYVSAISQRLEIDFLIARHLRIILPPSCNDIPSYFFLFLNDDDKLSSCRSRVELSIREAHYSARSEVIEVVRLTPRLELSRQST